MASDKVLGGQCELPQISRREDSSEGESLRSWQTERMAETRRARISGAIDESLNGEYEFRSADDVGDTVPPATPLLRHFVDINAAPDRTACGERVTDEAVATYGETITGNARQVTCPRCRAYIMDREDRRSPRVHFHNPEHPRLTACMEECEIVLARNATITVVPANVTCIFCVPLAAVDWHQRSRRRVTPEDARAEARRIADSLRRHTHPTPLSDPHSIPPLPSVGRMNIDTVLGPSQTTACIDVGNGLVDYRLSQQTYEDGELRTAMLTPVGGGPSVALRCEADGSWVVLAPERDVDETTPAHVSAAMMRHLVNPDNLLQTVCGVDCDDVVIAQFGTVVTVQELSLAAAVARESITCRSCCDLIEPLPDGSIFIRGRVHLGDARIVYDHLTICGEDRNRMVARGEEITDVVRDATCERCLELLHVGSQEERRDDARPVRHYPGNRGGTRTACDLDRAAARERGEETVGREGAGLVTCEVCRRQVIRDVARSDAPINRLIDDRSPRPDLFAGIDREAIETRQLALPDERVWESRFRNTPIVTPPPSSFTNEQIDEMNQRTREMLASVDTPPVPFEIVDAAANRTRFTVEIAGAADPENPASISLRTMAEGAEASGAPMMDWMREQVTGATGLPPHMVNPDAPRPPERDMPVNHDRFINPDVLRPPEQVDVAHLFALSGSQLHFNAERAARELSLPEMGRENLERLARSIGLEPPTAALTASDMREQLSAQLRTVARDTHESRGRGYVSVDAVNLAEPDAGGCAVPGCLHFAGFQGHCRMHHSGYSRRHDLPWEMGAGNVRLALGLRPFEEFAAECRVTNEGNLHLFPTSQHDMHRVRNTGRTTCMLCDALAAVSRGERVVIFGHTTQHTRHLWSHARSLAGQIPDLDMYLVQFFGTVEMAQRSGEQLTSFHDHTWWERNAADATLDT